MNSRDTLETRLGRVRRLPPEPAGQLPQGAVRLPGQHPADPSDGGPGADREPEAGRPGLDEPLDRDRRSRSSPRRCAAPTSSPSTIRRPASTPRPAACWRRPARSWRTARAASSSRRASTASSSSREHGVFGAPALLLEEVKDPTGAGDSFAGGFMGYLAETGDLSFAGIKRALIHGTAVASFTVESLGIDRLAIDHPRRRPGALPRASRVHQLRDDRHQCAEARSRPSHEKGRILHGNFGQRTTTSRTSASPIAACSRWSGPARRCRSSS